MSRRLLKRSGGRPNDRHGPHRHRRRGAHAHGRLSRRLEGCSAHALGAARFRRRSRGPGSTADSVDEILMGCVLPAGLGQAPARQAALGAGLPLGGGRDHHQQDVRLGHEGGDGRPRSSARRLGRCRGRRRHGEHEQRALSARSRALRLSHGPRPRHRSHVSRRPRGRLRQGPADGDLRRGLRGSLSVHPGRRRTPMP